MYRIAMFFVILSFLSIGHGTSADDIKVTVQDLHDLIGRNFTFEDEVFSPSGETLAWIEIDTGLCLYDMTESSVECIPWEWDDDGFANEFTNNGGMTLAWSYDSSHLVIAKNFTGRVLFDSDIWLFDVEEREFSNITDDRYSGLVGASFDYDETEVWADSFPIWIPESRELIFFRSYPIRLEDSAENRYLPYFVGLEIYRYSVDMGTLTFEYTVPERFSPYILTPAISSDGTHIGLFLFGDTIESFESLSGLWVINLQEDTLRKLVTLPDFEVSRPDWIQDGQFHTGFDSSVQWVANNEGIIVANLTDGEDLPFLLNFHYIDLQTGQISSLVDLSNLSEPYVEDNWRELYDRPLFGFVSSDRNQFFYGHNTPDSEQILIESVLLPPNGLNSPVTQIDSHPFQHFLNLDLRVMSGNKRTTIARNLLLIIEDMNSD